MEFEKFFKYVYFILIQTIAFSMMYNINLEMLGYGVGIIMSFVAAWFLWIDIYNSPKSNEPLVFVVLLTMLGGVISLLMFARFLTKTHSKFNKKGSRILLTRESRAKLNRYRYFYMLSYYTIVLLAFAFFLRKNPVGNNYEFFFQIPSHFFSKDGLFFSAKVMFSMLSLAITGYLIYIANELRKLNANQLYIPEGGIDDGMKKYPLKRNRGSWMGDIRNFFRNISWNYVMNYNIQRT